MDNTLIDRIVGVFSRAAMPIVSCALAMAIAFIPGTALAGADDEGDLDAPNAAAGGTSAQSAQEDTAIDDAVNIAADGKSASVEGSPFALEDFSRSQVGSNSDVNGVYCGYTYRVARLRTCRRRLRGRRRRRPLPWSTCTFETARPGLSGPDSSDPDALEDSSRPVAVRLSTLTTPTAG